MAQRVDSDGYLITADGTRLPDNQQSHHDEFKKQINDAWAAGHKGQSAPPQGTVIMLADKGDCQWTIAEDAGADPSQTAYSVNGQYASNPDLIHPGDVVFLGEIGTYRQYTNGTDNREMFDSQYTARTKDAKDTDLTADTARYFASVPAGQRQAILSSVLPAGDSPVEQQKTQEIFEGYLLSFPPAERAEKLKDLRAQYTDSKDHPAPDESTSVTWERYRGALDEAAKKLGL